MAYVDWEVIGKTFANCSCDFGCPCQFNSLPTTGNCEAVAGFLFNKGHFGDTRLDGLKAALVVHWPGPIHEGKGIWQIVIDKNADDAQREALRAIMYGEETEPGATMWNVFMSTVETVHEPIYADIEFQIDVDERQAQLKVPDRIEAVGEPIRNPITGAPHRARLDIPNGFEFKIAEVGSGTATAKGDIPLTLSGSHAHFADLHLSPYGIVS